MKKGSILFLRILITLIGLGVLALLLRFPMTEGRAANLDLFSIYWDPFIAYGYLGSIPFFVALYQVFKLLGYIGQNNFFSQASIKTLRIMKYCAILTGVFFVIGILLLITFAGGEGEDVAGPVALGIYATFAVIIATTVLAILQRLLQNAVDIKSENDLTV